jgi:membrane-bound serine protease (ClpP class)
MRRVNRRINFLGGAFCAVALAVVLLLAWSSRAHAQTPQPLVLELTFDDTIQPISAEVFTNAIARANEEHAAAIVISMNTPGGMLDSTRLMVESIEHSKVPVIVFVAPSGAHAASAGFFVLEAADVAAMAPGTNTGAAHPVLQGGAEPGGVMKEKMENDAAAFIRSIASHRNRNAQAAEDAVRQSKAYSDSEALQLNLIEVVADNTDDLLRKLDGRSVTLFDGKQETLALKNPQIEVVKLAVREEILDKLMNPDFAILMLIGGVLLIYVEFHVPGTIVPGAIGTLLVLLALFALNLLPLHYASVMLLVVGLLMLIGEAKFPSHGLLSLAGGIVLVLGLLTLVNGPIPQLRVHPAMAIATGATFALITLALAILAVRARRNKSATGPESMIGLVAVAQTALNPKGQVLVRGEIWNARATTTAHKHARVRVDSVDGLTLVVTPTE